MIVSFSVGNFKSINEKVILSFSAESLKQHEKTNLISTDFPKLYLLKALAIYGANASGKTNIIKALSFMREFVLTSSTEYQPNQKINVEPYKLIKKNLEEPSFFEIDFIIYNSRYRYGFQVSKDKILTEYLFSVLKTTEKILFKRYDNNEIEFDTSFHEGFGKQKFIKSNSLLISTVAQLNGSVSRQIIEWFNNLTIITDYNYLSYTGYTAKLLQNSKYRDFFIRFFKAVEFDIENLEVKALNIDDNLTQFLSEDVKEIVRKNLPHQYKIYTRHKVFDLKGDEIDTVDFDLKSESAGTQKFLAISGPIVNSLLNGYPIVIDELDAKLHFLLVHFLVKLYCNEKLTKYGGQIAFSNHMLDIMDRELLRRDQIILVSKKKTGTQLASTHSLGFRSDAVFKKEYLSNQYGIVPDISLNQTELFEGFI